MASDQHILSGIVTTEMQIIQFVCSLRAGKTNDPCVHIVHHYIDHMLLQVGFHCEFEDFSDAKTPFNYTPSKNFTALGWYHGGRYIFFSFVALITR